jgi:ATP-dependent exoDNAse (exonuclease V) alpha subunit
MLEELDTAVLTRDLPAQGLVTGDIGAIVHRSPDGQALDVEFVTADGRTVAVERLSASDLRPMRDDEILHARKVSAP